MGICISRFMDGTASGYDAGSRVLASTMDALNPLRAARHVQCLHRTGCVLVGIDSGIGVVMKSSGQGLTVDISDRKCWYSVDCGSDSRLISAQLLYAPDWHAGNDAKDTQRPIIVKRHQIQISFSVSVLWKIVGTVIPSHCLYSWLQFYCFTLVGPACVWTESMYRHRRCKT
jgi:hypothetical protein